MKRIVIRMATMGWFLGSFAAITLIISSLAYGGARFVPLGYLDETDSFGQGQGISADGETVVGTSNNKPFRWTEAEGMVYVGDFPWAVGSVHVYGISGDGNVIFGNAGKNFQWTQDAGYQEIFPGLNVSLSGIAYDGSAYSYEPDTDISTDGTITVGREVHLLGEEAYRDSPNDFGGTTRQWLGELPGGEYGSIPRAVSANGEVVVGQSSTTADNMGTIVDISRPFYWTEELGIIALESWPKGTASDVSDSGLVVIGKGVTSIEENNWEAFRWTPASGIVSLHALLLAEGIDVEAMGWTLSGDYVVSANGRVIAGTGHNPTGQVEAFLIELPVPGDFDEDGDSDGADFLAWQRGESHHFMSPSDLDDWNVNFEFFGTATGASTSANVVPEPSSTLLLLAALTYGMQRRRLA